MGSFANGAVWRIVIDECFFGDIFLGIGEVTSQNSCFLQQGGCLHDFLREQDFRIFVASLGDIEKPLSVDSEKAIKTGSIEEDGLGGPLRKDIRRLRFVESIGKGVIVAIPHLIEHLFATVFIPGQVIFLPNSQSVDNFSGGGFQ